LPGQAEDLTLELYQRRLAVSDKVTASTQRLWQGIDGNNLDSEWDKYQSQFAMQAYNGQLASATMTNNYLTQISAIQGFDEQPYISSPDLHAGVAPDGRGLTPLLYGAVTETKTATGAGYALRDAMQVGAGFLAMAMKTVIADMGRQHDMVSSLGRGYKTYVRAVSPGACSRCAVLAGTYSSAVAFPRHPNCQCIAVPMNDPRRLNMRKYENPSDYFESLTLAEQERIFTTAGSQAIRDGADINQVVNARRGASGISYSGAIGNSTRPNSGRKLTPITIGKWPDGKPRQIFVTSEGTTKRGMYARGVRNDPTRTTSKYRLMPEQIYLEAGNDPVFARELLERYGYIHKM